MKEREKDKGCVVLELRCECGRVLYLAASREEPCLLALGTSPTAAAAALTQKEMSPEGGRDED